MRAATVVRGAALGLAALAAAGSTADAQTTLGVRGGVSVASVDLDVGEVFDDANRTGFVGGVFMDWSGGGLFGFQAGAQYNQKGAELDFGDVVDELTLSYLEVPVVAKVGLPLGTIKPSVLGGVALGFNTGCDQGDLDGDDSDCGDDVKSTEFSGIVGADVAFYLSGLSVWVDGRYHFGLSDVSDAVDIDQLKNRAWAFQAGLGFPLGI